MAMKKKILAFLCGALLSFFPSCTWAAEHAGNYIAVGQSNVGSLYVDLDNVKVVHGESAAFLIVAVEERYQDQGFIADIRSTEGLENAVGMLTLYMFDNFGRTYCIVAQHIYDDKGNICLNLGNDMEIKDVGNDKTLLKIYEVALKSMESKAKVPSWGR